MFVPSRAARAGTVAAGLLIAALVAFEPHAAQAWEPDVHYGLTRWLALQAGFTERQAGWIAQGDEGVDDSWITGPVHGTLVSACVGSDASGSAAMHDNHFPSRGDPPAAPSVRSVRPGLVWHEGARRPPPPLDGSEASYLRLGRYLHALQDTWSHQGTPDVPTLCRAELGWGHAVERGGWSCHLADLTYRWHDTDVPAMAQASYDALREARRKPRLGLSTEQRAKLGQFASARTKWQKDAWFRNERFAERSFLQGVSLPDCEPEASSCIPYAYEKLLDRWEKGAAPGKRSLQDVPREIVALFDAFFEGLIEQNGTIRTKELVDESLARVALARALHVEAPCLQLYDALYEYSLGSGFATGRGAQAPTQLCELAAALRDGGGGPIACDQAVAAARTALGLSAARGPGLHPLADKVGHPRAFDYAVTHDSASDTYFATARFVHLPRDLLIAGARQRAGSGAKITGFLWVPSE